MNYWYVEADGYWYAFLPDGTLHRSLSENVAKDVAEETEKVLGKKQAQFQDARFMWYALRESLIG